MERFDILRNGDHAGYLERRGRRLIFREAAPSAGSPPWRDGADAAPWLSNALPEGRRRRAFEFFIKSSVDDLPKFLEGFGEDLPGDISAIGKRKGRSDDIGRLLEEMIDQGESIDCLNFKCSLAGAIPKVPLAVEDGAGGRRFSLPRADSPSTHILKSPGCMAVPEALPMRFASFCGLFPAAGTELISIAGKPVLLVGRYDRRDGRKTFQEDFCQCLGMPADAKYDIDHGRMAAAMLERLPQADREAFLSMSFFNMIVGNSDDHAKNFSMVFDGSWHLAPAYDIVSAALLKDLARDGIAPGRLAGLDLRQARCFGRHRDPYRINGKDIAWMGRLFDIPAERVGSLMLSAVSACENSAGKFIDGFSLPDLRRDAGEYAEACMERFPKIVLKRAKGLLPVFEKAARDARLGKIRLKP